MLRIKSGQAACSASPFFIKCTVLSFWPPHDSFESHRQNAIEIYILQENPLESLKQFLSKKWKMPGFSFPKFKLYEKAIGIKIE